MATELEKQLAEALLHIENAATDLRVQRYEIRAAATEALAAFDAQQSAPSESAECGNTPYDEGPFAMAAPSERAQGDACPCCGNEYLATRSDIFKDKRPVTYCDSCGAMADERVWKLALAQQPAAGVALTDWQIIDVYQRWRQRDGSTPAQLMQAAIAEFCRINGITASAAQEPKP